MSFAEPGSEPPSPKRRKRERSPSSSSFLVPSPGKPSTSAPQEPNSGSFFSALFGSSSAPPSSARAAQPQPPQTPTTTTANTIDLTSTTVAAANTEDTIPFSIVVGGRKFKLSWGSLTTDSPNYFTEMFNTSKSKVIYIDRDPNLFELIVQHLRGYFVTPKDEYQCENLIYDAHFYGLRRLKLLLRESRFINVGGRVFHLSTELLGKDSPNYFTGPLLHLSHPEFIDREQPPTFISRDPDLFADIVQHLKGYTINIRDETHRNNLLKDSRFYALRQLHDKLLVSRKIVNGFGEVMSTRPEVLLWLKDVRIVSLVPPATVSSTLVAPTVSSDTVDKPSLSTSPATTTTPPPTDPYANEHYAKHTQVMYKKEDKLHALLVQCVDSQLRCHYSATTATTYTLEVPDTELRKLKDMANALKAPKGPDLRVHLDPACAISIDDVPVSAEELTAIGSLTAPEVKDEDPASISTPMPVYADHVHRDELWKLVRLARPDYVVGEGTCLKLCIDRAIVSVHLVEERLCFSLVRFEAISSRLQLNLKREFLP